MTAKPHKVFLVGGSHDIGLMYKKLGWTIVEKMDQADLIQFLPGSDVDPFLYGQGPHKLTLHNPERDRREIVVYGVAMAKNKPMAGICRGAQFLNVMCGGSLWQDTDGHVIAGTHSVMDAGSGEVFEATSTHHQMMEPARQGAYVVAFAKESKLRDRCDNNGNTFTVATGRRDDAEAIYYKKQNVFCFQPHPESVRDSELAIIYNNYLETYCFN